MRCEAQCLTQERWPRPYPCSRNAVVERDGKHFCKMHDPDVIAAKRKARDDAFRAEQDKQQALQAKAEELTAALGMPARIYYESMLKPHGYRPALVIAFDDVEKLIERLRR